MARWKRGGMLLTLKLWREGAAAPPPPRSLVGGGEEGATDRRLPGNLLRYPSIHGAVPPTAEEVAWPYRKEGSIPWQQGEGRDGQQHEITRWHACPCIRIRAKEHSTIANRPWRCSWYGGSGVGWDGCSKQTVCAAGAGYRCQPRAISHVHTYVGT